MQEDDLREVNEKWHTLQTERDGLIVVTSAFLLWLFQAFSEDMNLRSVRRRLTDILCGVFGFGVQGWYMTHAVWGSRAQGFLTVGWFMV